MKKITYFLSAALLSIGLASCSLDAENLTERTTDNFPVTEDDATAVLASIYENLNAVNANPQMSFFYLSMLASDDNLGGGGENDKLMQALDLMCNYNANMTEQFYKDRYEGINRANTLIAAIPNTNLSDDVKNNVMGEAKFLRAFYYYELASQYGNVPLLTAPSNAIVTQGEVSTLWGQILQDLKEATDLLPAVRKTDGHVDKYTAEAMLTRAWLFYTGMYGNGETIEALTSTNYNPLTEVELPDGTVLKKDQVEKLIKDCVDNSGYDLVNDFRNLWAYTNKYTVEEYDYTKGKGLAFVENDNGENIESMFAVKFNKLASWNTTIGYGNGYALHFGIRGGQDLDKTFPFGQGWGAGPVAPNLVKDWQAEEPNDLRLDASIQNVNELPGYKFGGWADFVQETDYYEKKLSAISGYDNDGKLQPCFEVAMYGNTGWSNGVNFQTSNIHDLVLIRFADALLMWSEITGTVDGINRVRERVGLPKISSYSLEALQRERRHELAFEGVRWNDIRRWHIAAAALAKQTNVDVYLRGEKSLNRPQNGGYIARYNATAGFQKMPENQISLGSVVQNPGWESGSEYSGWE